MKRIKNFLIGLLITTIVIIVPTIYITKNDSNPDKHILNLKKGIITLSSAVKMADAQDDMNFAQVNSPCPQNSFENDSPNNNEGISFCSIFNEFLTGHKYYGKISPENKQNLQYKIIETKTIKDPLKNFNLYLLSDGMIVGVPDALETTKCTIEGTTIDSLSEECVGFIDINGVNPPNKEATCEDGTTKLVLNATNDDITKCTPSLKKKHLTDIFPVLFYDNNVEPATTAGKRIITTDRKNYQ